jgi:hypothetical protein
MSIPDFDKVFLLLPFNEADGATSFVDRSKYARAISAAFTTISTAQQKFYGRSAYLGGSGRLHASTINSLLQGASEFTIEGWFYRATGTDSSDVMFAWNDSGYGNRLVVTVGSVFGTSITTTTFTSAPIGAWYHFALVRTSTNWAGFIDGTQVFDVAGSNGIASSDFFSIGQEYDTGGTISDTFTGYIQDFCGTLTAKYTASFTPPTSMIGSISTTSANPILDDTNTAAVRKVIAFIRTNPTFLVSTTSASDGSFSLTNLPVAEHTVVYLDDDAGTFYNDKVNRVIPA